MMKQTRPIAQAGVGNGTTGSARGCRESPHAPDCTEKGTGYALALRIVCDGSRKDLRLANWSVTDAGKRPRKWLPGAEAWCSSGDPGWVEERRWRLRDGGTSTGQEDGKQAEHSYSNGVRATAGTQRLNSRCSFSEVFLSEAQFSKPW